MNLLFKKPERLTVPREMVEVLSLYTQLCKQLLFPVLSDAQACAVCAASGHRWPEREWGIQIWTTCQCLWWNYSCHSQFWVNYYQFDIIKPGVGRVVNCRLWAAQAAEQQKPEASGYHREEWLREQGVSEAASLDPSTPETAARG